VSKPDFDRVSKDEIITWFDTADDISPILTSMAAATEPVARPTTETPMALASIRLPVAMVEQLDSLADLQGVRRSDVIREALAAYITERTAPVGRDEAEHALEVLRKIVTSRTEQHPKAA
jgi:predicted DNA-binding protein